MKRISDEIKAESRAWFEKKFMEWRGTQTTRKAGPTHFARYLGIDLNLINNYMLRGSCPEGDNLAKVGKVLGEEIYEIWGLPKPDPHVAAMVNWFTGLPDEMKKKAEELMQQLAEGKQLSTPENIPPTIAEIVGQLIKMPVEDVEEYAAMLRAKAAGRKRAAKVAKADTHH